MNRIILYKSGKFYGYESPEEPTKSPAAGVIHERIEKDARANALEIENPELANVSKRDNEWILKEREPFTSLNIRRALKDSDTFPLPDTLEWEVIKYFDEAFWDRDKNLDFENPEPTRQVLRLKEKAVVIGTKTYDFLSEDTVNAAKGIGGIVAIGGIPENDDTLPADGKFKEVFDKSSLFKKDVGGIEERGEKSSDRYIPTTEVDPAFTEAQLREKLRNANKRIVEAACSENAQSEQKVINHINSLLFRAAAALRLEESEDGLVKSIERYLNEHYPEPSPQEESKEESLGDQECSYCGEIYDSNSEGHTHYEDGSCECKYCTAHDKMKGLSFCSPECEGHYVTENNIPIPPRKQPTNQ